MTKSVDFVSVGSVSITSISQLDFFAFTSPANRDIIFRQIDNWDIQVPDTRTSGGDWYLYAYIDQPLSHETSQLENTLIYRSSNLHS